MAVNYTTEYEYGSGSIQPERNLAVHLYPNYDDLDDECVSGGDAFHGVRTCGEQLVDDGHIDYFCIKTTYVYPDVDDVDPAPNEIYDSFANWASNHDIADVGTQLLVCEGGEGYTSAASSYNESALVSSRCAIAGSTSAYNINRVTASHETLHTIINGNDPLVRDMAVNHSASGNIHHDLGTNLDSTGVTTPLAAGYGGTHAHHGECGKDYLGVQQNVTEDLTNCTEEAVGHTVSGLDS